MSSRTRRLRSFRLAAAMLLVGCAGAHAESVYKCLGAGGRVAYQDHACAATERASQVEILPAPPVAPSPDYGVGSNDRPRRSVPSSRGAKPRAEVVSYECRASNGEIFYRHGSCPKTVTAKSGAKAGGKRSKGAASETYAVTAEALPRGDACRRMASAGSVGRAGRDRDDTVSSYERNLGRDPCRRF